MFYVDKMLGLHVFALTRLLKKLESFQKCGGVFICCLNEIEAFANIVTVETKQRTFEAKYAIISQFYFIVPVKCVDTTFHTYP